MTILEENRKRKHIVKCRLNEKELESFNHKVEKSKLSKEEFIRSAIFKMKIVNPPGLDFYKLKNEINPIGNNLNQLTRLANSGLDIDTNLINETIETINSFFKKYGGI